MCSVLLCASLQLVEKCWKQTSIWFELVWWFAIVQTSSFSSNRSDKTVSHLWMVPIVPVVPILTCSPFRPGPTFDMVLTARTAPVALCLIGSWLCFHYPFQHESPAWHNKMFKTCFSQQCSMSFQPGTRHRSIGPFSKLLGLRYCCRGCQRRDFRRQSLGSAEMAPYMLLFTSMLNLLCQNEWTNERMSCHVMSCNVMSCLWHMCTYVYIYM